MMDNPMISWDLSISVIYTILMISGELGAKKLKKKNKILMRVKDSSDII